MRFAPFAHLPRGAFTILHEVSRHLLRRPVVGIAAGVRVPDGRWVMIRRGDTGTWCLPGGTLEWGETLLDGLRRELEEEAGVTDAKLERVVGIYSRPDRDLRFHAVTIVVECTASEPKKPPKNRLEIPEVKLLRAEEVPRPLAMGMDDAFQALTGPAAPTSIE